MLVDRIVVVAPIRGFVFPEIENVVGFRSAEADRRYPAAREVDVLDLVLDADGVRCGQYLHHVGRRACAGRPDVAVFAQHDARRGTRQVDCFRDGVAGRVDHQQFGARCGVYLAAGIDHLDFQGAFRTCDFAVELAVLQVGDVDCTAVSDIGFVGADYREVGRCAQVAELVVRVVGHIGHRLGVRNGQVTVESFGLFAVLGEDVGFTAEEAHVLRRDTEFARRIGLRIDRFGDLSVVADEDERAGHGGKVAFVEDEGAGVVGAVNGYFASYGVAGAFGVENGHVDDVVTQFGCREGVLLGLSDLFVVDFPEVSSLVGVGADCFEGQRAAQCQCDGLGRIGACRRFDRNLRSGERFVLLAAGGDDQQSEKGE